MAGTDFIENLRSVFENLKDQINTEKSAAQAEAKSQQAQVEAKKAQEEAQKAANLQEVKTKISDFVKSLRDTMNSKQPIEALKTPDEVKPIDDEYTVSYTYKPGDNFGKVITDLGLKTDSGLWGANGDVAYYTSQLVDQGALDRNGNIPVGTTIRLRRRGAPEIKMSEEVTPNMGKITEEAKYPALQQIIRSGARKV